MVLDIQSISKSYRGVKAVDNISFKVQPGHIVGLLGPNGAGKTTTMSIITGIISSDEGKVLFDGATMKEKELEIKSKIGFLSEANPLYGEMLVGEYLHFVASLRGMTKEEQDKAIAKAAEQTGILDKLNKPIEELSKGYKQRVGLAQAILHEPEILILDEPTEGLDPNQRVTIRDLISKLGENRTVIISTHVLPEVQAMCDQVIILNKGKVVQKGDVQDIVAKGQSSQVVTFSVRGEGVKAKLQAKGYEIAESSSNEVIQTFKVLSKSEEDIRPELFRLAKAQDWTLYELHQEQASLEDIFRSLTTSSPTSEAEESKPKEEVKQ